MNQHDERVALIAVIRSLTDSRLPAKQSQSLAGVLADALLAAGWTRGGAEAGLREAARAAYAAGQRKMRARASAEVRKVQFRTPTRPSGMFPVEVQEAIRALTINSAPQAVAEAAKLILAQPKKPDGPVAEAFACACAYLEDQECGAEKTNEIIETFLKTLAGESN